jgi:hypothetical protein
VDKPGTTVMASVPWPGLRLDQRARGDIASLDGASCLDRTLSMPRSRPGKRAALMAQAGLGQGKRERPGRRPRQRS